MKKISLFLVVFVLIGSSLLLSGCGKKESNWGDNVSEEVAKNDPENPFRKEYKDSEGNYFYENKELEFNISLPPEFIYFQTQRWNNAPFTDLEILVPTNDPDYTNATPPSYAIPITVRIWKDMEAWAEENQDEYIIFGEKKYKIYTIKLWENPTKDWAEKWTDELIEKIEKGVKML